jgi:histidyl-tRNA synthetase
MKAADKSGARYTFVLGERESESGTIELKELASGAVQSIRLSDLPQFLMRSLGANS